MKTINLARREYVRCIFCGFFARDRGYIPMHGLPYDCVLNLRKLLRMAMGK